MSSPTAKVSLFAIPKPMDGEARLLQRNAFESWRRLGDEVEVFLCGDENGIARTASEFKFRHIPTLKRNDSNTPLLDDCFQQVRQTANTRLLAYVNADIILGHDFLSAIHTISDLPINRFLAIGQRWESELQQEIESWDHDKLESWIRKQRQQAPKASVVCKDYFVFPRHLFNQIPSFAVGRGNWDNWMVYHSHKQGIPVIDLTDKVTAVHQPHGHAHCGGRMKAYVAGQEAKTNQWLAGGKHLWWGSQASHRITDSGDFVSMGHRWVSRTFWDLPRFMQLVTSFLIVPTGKSN